MKKIIVIAVVLVLVGFIAVRLMDVRAKNTTQNTEITSINEVSVTVADVAVNKDNFKLEFTGTLYPIKELDIPAETQGRITSLNFRLGQNVSAGTVLAKIDDKLKKISYASANTDADKLKKDYERTNNLFQSGTASEQELDNARLSYETAKIKLSEAERNLGFTQITSSISGTVIKKNVELGTYVNPGTVVASIVDISMLKIKLYVSETNVYNLKVGGKAAISTDVYPGKEFEGKISFISPSADASHNYLVEIEMSNSSSNPLKAGTFVKIGIEISSDKNAIFIPREALQGSIKSAKVYVVNNGKAVLKDIVIGNSNNQSLEVLSGLDATDKVIVSGQVNLTDGKEIKIINN